MFSLAGFKTIQYDLLTVRQELLGPPVLATSVGACVSDLQHFHHRWNKGGLVAVLVHENASKVQTTGMTVNLVDLDYL